MGCRLRKFSWQWLKRVAAALLVVALAGLMIEFLPLELGVLAVTAAMSQMGLIRHRVTSAWFERLHKLRASATAQLKQLWGETAAQPDATQPDKERRP